jgi:hypothetical protein
LALLLPALVDSFCLAIILSPDSDKVKQKEKPRKKHRNRDARSEQNGSALALASLSNGKDHKVGKQNRGC